jgi:hypothetical protein
LRFPGLCVAVEELHVSPRSANQYVLPYLVNAQVATDVVCPCVSLQAIGDGPRLSASLGDAGE